MNQSSNPVFVSVLYIPSVFYNAMMDAFFFGVKPDLNEIVTIVIVVSVNVIWIVHKA